MEYILVVDKKYIVRRDGKVKKFEKNYVSYNVNQQENNIN